MDKMDSDILIFLITSNITDTSFFFKCHYVFNVKLSITGEASYYDAAEKYFAEDHRMISLSRMKSSEALNMHLSASIN